MGSRSFVEPTRSVGTQLKRCDKPCLLDHPSIRAYLKLQTYPIPKTRNMAPLSIAASNSDLDRRSNCPNFSEFSQASLTVQLGSPDFYCQWHTWYWPRHEGSITCPLPKSAIFDAQTELKRTFKNSLVQWQWTRECQMVQTSRNRLNMY